MLRRTRLAWRLAGMVVVVLGLAGCGGGLDANAPAAPSASGGGSGDACAADAISVGPQLADLQAAVDGARPGDVLALAETTYTGTLEITRSGTEAAPIVLCGSEDSVIEGGATDGGYVLHLRGASHWRLEGFRITNGGKGIVLDDSNHNEITGIEVSRIGDEGIHLRAHSSDNVVEGNTISATGLRTPEFGEGIYVGSAESNWCEYTGCEPDRSDRNTIRGNTIVDTTAEAIDIKEGTTGGRLVGNALTGSDRAVVDSLIDLKGAQWEVSGNTLTSTRGDGASIHVIVPGWGAQNVLGGNVIAVPDDRLGIEVVGDARAAGNIVRCDNATPAGARVSSNVSCR
ncbi:right-handed parallel beta-helix repeat-containing protein [Microbacterium sp. LRZ72]|uniref:right-handed parallel beta-helix repeat-containing protein n=1 Tax=Microbacterium sp. LRZ72 TaxID=2942481 RepID=UPI0029BD0D07|nr:right-handed parallel beta-helix repeat-containing protein [Microbacterium sp. LRZ72]MDX2377864.1 right-handed parallel beta-helix repeat-containing protein [Microbacterium sp. LRZ72]